jgi:hypothetical protein
VGVPCPGCGREYDVALFQFGRTIHCTCGRRVGLAPRRRLPDAPPPRFLADAMLGRLARWLRLLGFDTAYSAHVADGDLVRRAVEEGRVILTRDRALPDEWRVSGVHVLGAETLLEQLRDVVGAFGLAPHVRPLSRCSECNGVLVRAPREEVAVEVPPRVLARQREFQRCPGCRRVYWRGSHATRMKRVVDRVLAGR